MKPAATPEGEGPPAAVTAEPQKLRRSRELSRLSVHGWIAGLAGAATVLVMGYLGSTRGVMTNGAGPSSARAIPRWPRPSPCW